MKTERDIASVLASFESFDFTLTTIGYFRSPQVVLYLAPEPAAPFEALTCAFSRTFLDTQPYGGVFAEIIPHVSVADEGDAATLAAIEADVGPRLPIRATAHEVQLVEHAPQGWSGRQSFKLGNSG